MKPEEFLNKEVRLSGPNAGVGVIVDSSFDALFPEAICIAVQVKGKRKPLKFFLNNAFGSGSIRFVDEDINRYVRSELSKEDEGKAVAEKATALAKAKEKETADKAAALARTKEKEEAEKRAALAMTRLVVCVKKWDRDNARGARTFDVSSDSKEDLLRELAPTSIAFPETPLGEKCLSFTHYCRFSGVPRGWVDAEGNPKEVYWISRKRGLSRIERLGCWEDTISKEPPLYCLFYEKDSGGNLKELRLDRIEARKRILIPTYAKHVVKTTAYRFLKGLYEEKKKIALFDFHAYPENDMVKVVNSLRPMSHAFVIKMLLQGDIEVQGETVVDHLGVLGPVSPSDKRSPSTGIKDFKRVVLPLKRFEAQVDCWSSRDWPTGRLLRIYGRKELPEDELLATRGSYLECATDWTDRDSLYWGVNQFTGEGENHLGFRLMWIRDELKEVELEIGEDGVPVIHDKQT